MRFTKVAVGAGDRLGTRRRVTMLAVALVTGASMAGLPGAAAAAPDQASILGANTAAAADCPAGNFCLWEEWQARGGRYFHDGNDGDLTNDAFRPGVPVANNASSVMNNGHMHAFDDVNVYDGRWSVGYLNCIGQGVYVDLFRSDNRIESFAWAPGTSC